MLKTAVNDNLVSQILIKLREHNIFPAYSSPELLSQLRDLMGSGDDVIDPMMVADLSSRSREELMARADAERIKVASPYMRLPWLGIRHCLFRLV